MPSMCGRCWQWRRRRSDRTAEPTGDGSRAGSANLDGQLVTSTPGFPTVGNKLTSLSAPLWESRFLAWLFLNQPGC